MTLVLKQDYGSSDTKKPTTSKRAPNYSRRISGSTFNGQFTPRHEFQGSQTSTAPSRRQSGAEKAIAKLAAYWTKVAEDDEPEESEESDSSRIKLKGESKQDNKKSDKKTPRMIVRITQQHIIMPNDTMPESFELPSSFKRFFESM